MSQKVGVRENKTVSSELLVYKVGNKVVDLHFHNSFTHLSFHSFIFEKRKRKKNSASGYVVSDGNPPVHQFRHFAVEPGRN